MPMPSRRDGLWRTYTNVIYANGMVLVPQYPDYCPDLDARALEVYRKLLPDWQVVGIDASSIIQKRGSLHCISLNVPFLPKADAQE
jgi:agmatine/peptidylarginine deiminase